MNNIIHDNENNKVLYNDLTNKDVNISKNIKSDNITVVNKVNNHELSKFNNTTDFNKSSVINVYQDTSNLVNNSSGKYIRVMFYLMKVLIIKVNLIKLLKVLD